MAAWAAVTCLRKAQQRAGGTSRQHLGPAARGHSSPPVPSVQHPVACKGPGTRLGKLYLPTVQSTNMCWKLPWVLERSSLLGTWDVQSQGLPLRGQKRGMAPSQTPRVPDSESAVQSVRGNRWEPAGEWVGAPRSRGTLAGGHSRLCLGDGSGGQRALVKPVMRFVMLNEGHGHFIVETCPIVCGLRLQPGHFCIGKTGSGKTVLVFQ